MEHEEFTAECIPQEMRLFTAVQGLIGKHRGIGSPRELCRDILLKDRNGPLVPTVEAIFEMLWPQEDS